MASAASTGSWDDDSLRGCTVEEQLAFAGRVDAALAAGGDVMESDTHEAAAGRSDGPKAELEESYASVSAFWTAALRGEDTKGWYAHSEWFWTSREGLEASDTGVLDGASELHEPDVSHSCTLLRSLLPDLDTARALDVAAGVGRVSEAVLAPVFDVVDLVDVSASLLEVARKRIDAGHLGDVALCRMHRLQPPSSRRYGCVWCQWCLGYVVDADLVPLLRRLAACLTPKGVLVVKETTLVEESDNAFTADASDLNIVRSRAYWSIVFEEAGLVVQQQQDQQPWKEDFLPVCAWVLRPR